MFIVAPQGELICAQSKLRSVGVLEIKTSEELEICRLDSGSAAR